MVFKANFGFTFEKIKTLYFLQKKRKNPFGKVKKISLKPFDIYRINAKLNLLQHPFKMGPSQPAERSPSSSGATFLHSFPNFNPNHRFFIPSLTEKQWEETRLTETVQHVSASSKSQILDSNPPPRDLPNRKCSDRQKTKQQRGWRAGSEEDLEKILLSSSWPLQKVRKCSAHLVYRPFRGKQTVRRFSNQCRVRGLKVNIAII